MQKDLYKFKKYKGRNLAIFKSSSSKVWSVYVDDKYLAKVVFYDEGNAFMWLRGYVDGLIDE